MKFKRIVFAVFLIFLLTASNKMISNFKTITYASSKYIEKPELNEEMSGKKITDIIHEHLIKSFNGLQLLPLKKMVLEATFSTSKIDKIKKIVMKTLNDDTSNNVTIMKNDMDYGIDTESINFNKIKHQINLKELENKITLENLKPNYDCKNPYAVDFEFIILIPCPNSNLIFHIEHYINTLNLDGTFKIDNRTIKKVIDMPKFPKFKEDK